MASITFVVGSQNLFAIILGGVTLHKSLGTRFHAEALHWRDAERFRFREKLGLAAQKRRDDFVVVETLIDDQIMDLSREVHARQWDFASSQWRVYALACLAAR